MIYYPGALVAPEHYIPLVHATQSLLAQAGVALHVAIARYPESNEILLSQEAAMKASVPTLEEALEALRASCGFEDTPSRLILAGHSMGSTFASHAAFFDPSSTDHNPLRKPRCRSILIHGGYTRPEYRSFQNLQAAPTAEIFGSRDGLLRLCNITEIQDELDRNVPDRADRARIAPVAILRGPNHASFANGETTEWVAPRDLPATVSAATATAAIADASAKFIMTTDPDAAAADATAAASFFEHSTRRAREDFFDVYRDALARDTAGDTCRDMQELLLGLRPCMGQPIAPRNAEDTGFGDDQVAVVQPRSWNTLPPENPDTPFLEHDAPFLRSKPKLFQEGGSAGDGDGETGSPAARSGRLQPWAQSSLALRKEPFFLASRPGSPMKLRCKLKSGHAVAAALATGVGITPGGPEYEGGGDPGTPLATSLPTPPQPGFREAIEAEAGRLDPFTVARINEHIVRSVLSRLPPHVRELYESSPRQLAFGPDVHAQQAPDWAASDLSFVDLLEDSTEAGGWRPPHEGGQVVLRSERVTTPPGETRFSGMFYCTVISEAQAFEYIMYESQKGAGIEVDSQGMLVTGRAAVRPNSDHR